VRSPEIGGAALLIAAKNDKIDVVMRLMKAKAPLGYSNWEGETPLHAAASRGQGMVVDALLQAGTSPDLTDRNGRTPLMLAAGSGHEDVVESLLRSGAEPDKADGDSWTALMHAAANSSYGAAGAIRRLVRAGAGVDRRAGSAGKTALMIAAEKGNENTVEALLRAGARPDLRWNGKTALDLAIAGNHKKCIEKLGGAGKAKSAGKD
jgi:ankyrin repeat protein